MIIVELPGDYERTFYHRISGDGVRAYFLFPFFSLQGKKKDVCVIMNYLPVDILRETLWRVQSCW